MKRSHISGFPSKQMICAWCWGRDSTKCCCINSWERTQAKSISLLLSSLLDRNLNHELCFLSRLGNRSQPTMMFFYYNLVANSQPQACAIADSFCSKEGSKTFLIIVFIPKIATIIREFKEGYMKVNYQKIIEATARDLKIILSDQRTITRSTKKINTFWIAIRI